MSGDRLRKQAFRTGETHNADGSFLGLSAEHRDCGIESDTLLLSAVTRADRIGTSC